MSTPKKRHPWQKPWRVGKKPQNRRPAQKQPKTRRVFVTLELETILPLSDLRSPKWWSHHIWLWGQAIQAQANVAKK